MEVLFVGEPENIIVIFAAVVGPDTLLEIVMLFATDPLMLPALDTEVMLPMGVSAAEDGTGVFNCLMVLRLSGAGALTVKLEGFWQSRLSSVETQQSHSLEAIL